MRSVKTVPCRTLEWDFCYNPFSVVCSPAFVDLNNKQLSIYS